MEEQKQLFSRVRHNKVVEVEEMLMAGTQARHALSRPSGACAGCMSQYAQADMRDEFGNSPLIVACQNGHKRCAKLLIKAGANVNAATINSYFPNCCDLAYSKPSLMFKFQNAVWWGGGCGRQRKGEEALDEVERKVLPFQLILILI